MVAVTVIDTLPVAEQDGELEYTPFPPLGPCKVRLRTYRTTAGVPLVVLTGREDEEAALLANSPHCAFHAAWERVGRPAPVRFFEHTAGFLSNAIEGMDGSEHITELFFPGTLAGEPCVDPDWWVNAAGEKWAEFAGQGEEEGLESKAVALVEFRELVGVTT